MTAVTRLIILLLVLVSVSAFAEDSGKSTKKKRPKGSYVSIMGRKVEATAPASRSKKLSVASSSQSGTAATEERINGVPKSAIAVPPPAARVNLPAHLYKPPGAK